MRLTIRDLLWLTLLAAVAVAWWVDRRAQAKRIDNLEKRALVTFDSSGDIDLQAIPPSIAPANSPFQTP